MKKLLLLFLISFGLFGCSSLPVGDALTSMELDDAMSSEDEAQRILALGLSHEENLGVYDGKEFFANGKVKDCVSPHDNSVIGKAKEGTEEDYQRILSNLTLHTGKDLYQHQLTD